MDSIWFSTRTHTHRVKFIVWVCNTNILWANFNWFELLIGFHEMCVCVSVCITWGLMYMYISVEIICHFYLHHIHIISWGQNEKFPFACMPTTFVMIFHVKISEFLAFGMRLNTEAKIDIGYFDLRPLSHWNCETNFDFFNMFIADIGFRISKDNWILSKYVHCEIRIERVLKAEGFPSIVWTKVRNECVLFFNFRFQNT